MVGEREERCGGGGGGGDLDSGWNQTESFGQKHETHSLIKLGWKRKALSLSAHTVSTSYSYNYGAKTITTYMYTKSLFTAEQVLVLTENTSYHYFGWLGGCIV